MKSCMLIVVLLLSTSIILGVMSGNQRPLSSLNIINDRIRNTPAVDPLATGTSIKIYLTTFGIHPFNLTDNPIYAPKPKSGSIIRFGLKNSEQLSTLDLYEESMLSQPFLTGIDPNCYSLADQENIELTFTTTFQYSASETGTEAEMRISSGTGCWASPVFFYEGESKKILVLNKSGCLMKVDVTNYPSVVDWKIDLRSIERQFDPTNSHKFEFMATPILVDGKIYINGIKMFHVIDVSNPSNQFSYSCIPAGEDYFESHTVFDTRQGYQRSFYSISHSGRIYVYNDGLIRILQPNVIGIAQTPPIIDVDGHIYFAVNTQNSIVMHYVEQNNRSNQGDIYTLKDYALPMEDVTAKSSILTDFTRNMYMLTNSGVIRIKEGYDFDDFDLTTDPVVYDDANAGFSISNTFLNVGDKFFSNHALLDFNANMRTAIYSINNSANAYGNNSYDFYPITQSKWNLSGSMIKVGYVSYNNAFVNSPTTLPEDQYSLGNTQSWGGIAPYISSDGVSQNAIFGDETGRIWTYSDQIAYDCVGFYPDVDSYSLFPKEIGMTKHLKNPNNIPTNNELPVFKVYLYGLNSDQCPLVFANSYAVNTTNELIPGTNISAACAVFSNLIPNKRYEVFWQSIPNQTNSCDFVDANSNIQFVVLNGVPDLVVENGIDYIDYNLDWQYVEPLHYNSITVLDGAHLKISSGSQIDVTNIYLNSGSKFSIGDYAIVVAQVIECRGYERIEIDVDETHLGKLIVRANFENLEESSVLLKGYNIYFNNPSYILNTISNKQDALINFKSDNPLSFSGYISASVANVQNKGFISINDCVEFLVSYVDNFNIDNVIVRGELNIKDGLNFGNLIWKISNGVIKSRFNVGINTLPDPTRAKLTIDNQNITFMGYGIGTTPPYNVYGNVFLKGESNCIVTNNATMLFHTSSYLDLRGEDDPGKNGAQLLIKSSTSGAGTVKFASGVRISGYKEDPALSNPYRYGDRIVTDNGGMIKGCETSDPRRLTNLNIYSTNPLLKKWEGIYINTTIDTNPFELHNSTIQYVDRMYIKKPNTDSKYYLNEYYHCNYGILVSNNQSLAIETKVTIDSCKFYFNKNAICVEDSVVNQQMQLSAIITNCKFGDQTHMESNEFGISLLRCKLAQITGCDFNLGAYGIFAVNSRVWVGGKYDLGTGQYSATDSCIFRYNHKSAIYLDQCSFEKSLIIDNYFIGTEPESSQQSGVGIWASSTIADVVNNKFYGLDGHGTIIRDYQWFSIGEVHQHGFATNLYHNNSGAELVGDPTSLEMIRNGENIFFDADYCEIGYDPIDPLCGEWRDWDKYILVDMAHKPGDTLPDDLSANDVRNNSFNTYLSERYYPSGGWFILLDQGGDYVLPLLSQGLEYYFNGMFNQSIDVMKNIVELYPDSTLTSFAMNFLFYAYRADEKDFSLLREYLDLHISSDNIETYLEKERIKTKCYLTEKDYPTAVDRLQLIINNPITISDSLFALIDQAYCYLNLAMSGAKALPNIVPKTKDFQGYKDFVVGLDFAALNQQNHNTPVERNVITIYPNPFNPITTIQYTSISKKNLTLSIYNSKGQKVRELVNEAKNPGKYKVVWNGKDTNGKPCASGVYFSRLEQGKNKSIQKMLLMK